MLTQAEYLQKLIASFELIYVEKLIYLVNRDLRVIYMSKLMLRLLNKQSCDVVGKYFLEVAPVPESNATLLEESLLQILDDQRSRKFLSVNSLRVGEENQMLLCVQTPYLYKGKVVAISLQGKQIDLPINIYSILTNQQPDKRALENNLDHVKLTQREDEIAFLLLYCKNSTEIAQIISVVGQQKVSEKTIRNIISRQLFVKFQVSDQKHLIEKLRSMKHYKKIPPHFLRNLHIDLDLL